MPLSAKKTKIPVDFDLVSQADERQLAISHLSVLGQSDMVVYDRGYYSYEMLYEHQKRNIHPVFRMKAMACKTVNGKEGSLDSPAKAILAGVGYLSEDRKSDGLVPDLSVRENLSLALLPKLSNSGQINRQREEEIVRKFVEALGIMTADIEQPVRELSGGNQQKVLLAR